VTLFEEFNDMETRQSIPFKKLLFFMLRTLVAAAIEKDAPPGARTHAAPTATARAA
jgi:hypothetical protein